MTTRSHQDAYQDINPVNLLGEKIQIGDEEKKLKEIKGSMFTSDEQLVLKFYDNTEKKMEEIPIENLEAAT